MGFFADRAAKSEIKVRDMVFEAFDLLENQGMAEEIGIEIDGQWGNVLLPCHIIKEAHNGFYLSGKGLTFGVFRCQGFWWAYPMEQEHLDALRGPSAQKVLYSTFASQPVRFGAFPGSGVLPFATSLYAAINEYGE